MSEGGGGGGARRPWLRALALALAAALFYGTWAYLANRGSGPGVGLRAASVQAIYSATSTLALVVLIERLFVLGRAGGRDLRRAFWIAGPGAAAAMIVILFAAHALAGTPRVLVTILPSMIVGSTFCITYAGGLRVAASRREGERGLAGGRDRGA